MVADLQIEAEEANGGVLLTVVDSARLTMLLTRETAAELLDAVGEFVEVFLPQVSLPGDGPVVDRHLV